MSALSKYNAPFYSTNREVCATVKVTYAIITSSRERENVSHDRKNQSHDRNIVSHDRKGVSHDRKRQSHDRNTVSHDSNYTSRDSKNFSRNRKGISPYIQAVYIALKQLTITGFLKYNY